LQGLHELPVSPIERPDGRRQQQYLAVKEGTVPS